MLLLLCLWCVLCRLTGCAVSGLGCCVCLRHMQGWCDARKKSVCGMLWFLAFLFWTGVSCNLYTLHGIAHEETSSKAGFSLFCVRLYHTRCTQCNISHAVAAVLGSGALGLVPTGHVSSSWRGLCALLLRPPAAGSGLQPHAFCRCMLACGPKHCVKEFFLGVI